ncbi:hypothetical protein RhiirA4_483640 [Rhizophagus irregularis]|uniref:Uncharacterized protein n=1 Tax=Rhizophagus irregularis TaxID=588596 RepID=A0A2I1HMU1_9GLOM|nr:hypothetical protein RhiirA4_483640 [Rhizophagus irregularis]
MSMIPVENIIFDELHAPEQITDRLWELMLAEIQENARSHVWKYISLMGDDKKTVLQFFNLNLLFKPSRAELIHKLWNGFYELYCALQNKNTNPAQLKQQFLGWLTLFLTPSQAYVRGLYMPNRITPYMHALVYYKWEFLEKHKRWRKSAIQEIIEYENRSLYFNYNAHF